MYDFALNQNLHESNAEACEDLSIAVIPSCDDISDVERILSEEQPDIELPPVHCATVYVSDSPESAASESDSPESAGAVGRTAE